MDPVHARAVVASEPIPTDMAAGQMPQQGPSEADIQAAMMHELGDERLNELPLEDNGGIAIDPETVRKFRLGGTPQTALAAHWQTFAPPADEQDKDDDIYHGQLFRYRDLQRQQEMGHTLPTGMHNPKTASSRGRGRGRHVGVSTTLAAIQQSATSQSSKPRATIAATTNASNRVNKTHGHGGSPILDPSTVLRKLSQLGASTVQPSLRGSNPSINNAVVSSSSHARRSHASAIHLANPGTFGDWLGSRRVSDKNSTESRISHEPASAQNSGACAIVSDVSQAVQVLKPGSGGQTHGTHDLPSNSIDPASKVIYVIKHALKSQQKRGDLMTLAMLELAKHHKKDTGIIRVICSESNRVFIAEVIRNKKLKRLPEDGTGAGFELEDAKGAIHRLHFSMLRYGRAFEVDFKDYANAYRQTSHLLSFDSDSDEEYQHVSTNDLLELDEFYATSVSGSVLEAGKNEDRALPTTRLHDLDDSTNHAFADPLIPFDQGTTAVDSDRLDDGPPSVKTTAILDDYRQQVINLHAKDIHEIALFKQAFKGGLKDSRFADAAPDTGNTAVGTHNPTITMQETASNEADRATQQSVQAMPRYSVDHMLSLRPTNGPPADIADKVEGVAEVKSSEASTANMPESKPVPVMNATRRPKSAGENREVISQRQVLQSMQRVTLSRSEKPSLKPSLHEGAVRIQGAEGSSRTNPVRTGDQVTRTADRTQHHQLQDERPLSHRGDGKASNTTLKSTVTPMVSPNSTPSRSRESGQKTSTVTKVMASPRGKENMPYKNASNGSPQPKRINGASQGGLASPQRVTDAATERPSTNVPLRPATTFNTLLNGGLAASIFA